MANNEQQLQATPMKKKTQILSLIFMFVLMAVTFYIIFSSISITEVLTVLSTSHKGFLFLGALFSIGFVAFQGFSIKICMDNLGSKISLFKSILYSSVGQYFCGITPSSTGGQPMQIYYMVRDKYPAAHVSLSLLMVNMAYQLMALLCALLFWMIVKTKITVEIAAVKALIVVGCVVGIGILLALILLVLEPKIFKKIVSFVISMGVKIHVVRDEESIRAKAESLIAEYSMGANAIRKNPKVFSKMCGFAFLEACCNYMVPFCVYKAFHLSGTSIFVFLALGAVMKIAVTFMPLPGSVGASEGTFAVLYKSIFGADYILPAMLMSRLLFFYIMLVVEAAVTFWVHSNPVKMRSDSPSPQVTTQEQ